MSIFRKQEPNDVNKEVGKIETREEKKEKAKAFEKKMYEKYPVQWVEITGYKALRPDMASWHDNKFKYELGVEQIFDGEPQLCRGGLHFCPALKDIKDYTNLIKSRIFEVKAVVDANYIARYNEILEYNDSHKYFSSSYSHQPTDTKLVAKSMTLVRELSAEEIWETFETTIKTESRYCYKGAISSLEDFIRFRFMPIETIKAMLLNDYRTKLIDTGYSDTFAIIIAEKLFREGRENHTVGPSSYSITRYAIDERLLNLAVAYADEGVSADMRAYLLSKEL